jgi:c-di-GMP-binding flagellar brake protein YcgR
MALKARITLSGHDHAKCAFTMPGGATSLNKHGAAIQVNRELLVGSIIVLQNRQTQASARVVTQVSAHRQGVYIYGVEFLDAGAVEKNFWGINFPSPAVPK